MKVLVAALFISASFFGFAAHAEDGRDFGPFLGIGFSRAQARVIQPGVETNLSGWGNSAEVGLDLPFSNTFGAIVSAELNEMDLRNVYRADDYLDQTSMKSKGARAALFYKALSLGYGYRMLTVDLKTVSSTTGASTAHLEGAGTYGFAAFSIEHKKILRGSLELQANTTELNGFSYTDYSIGLRAYILLGGLMN